MSSTTVSLLAYYKFIHVAANSYGDDFFNALASSSGWCISRRVRSDCWYLNVIAAGVDSCLCRTLRSGVNVPNKTAGYSQEYRDCTNLDDLNQ